MSSNYKRIGDYIQQVKVKNKEGKYSELLGINIDKFFMPSVANTVGVNLKNYKIVENEQFACNRMHVGRDYRIPVALSEKETPFLVSPAYDVFEIDKTDELLPEYLMMWFRRKEYDRNAWFHTDADVRGGLAWEAFCDLKLPIPSIEKQREIVKEYNTVTNRIKLNEQLNQKLEETAQALYKHWFVDFEFPNEEGKPYKSDGGKMIYNEELDKEIPKGWEFTVLGKLLDEKGYIRGPFGSALKKSDMHPKGIPVYEQQHAIYNHRDFRYFISEEKYKKLKRFSVKPDDLVISCSGTLGRITLIKKDDETGVINQALLILRTNKSIMEGVFLKCFLDSKEGNMMLLDGAGGSAQVNIAKREIIQSIPYALAPSHLIQKFTKKLKIIKMRINENMKQSILLQELQSLLLAKMTKVN